MYNFLKGGFIFVCSFLLFSNVLGHSESEMGDGIYLCTKDVNRSGFLVTKMVAEDYDVV